MGQQWGGLIALGGHWVRDHTNGEYEKSPIRGNYWVDIVMVVGKSTLHKSKGTLW